MSQPRSGMSAERRGGGRPTRATAVRQLIRVDLDQVAPEGPLAPAGPAWAQVVRRGHVVGLREVELVGGRLDAADFDAMLAEFPDHGPRDVDRVTERQLPSATVVVPTDGRRPELIARTVGQLLALRYPSFEVVLVDNRAGGADAPLAELPRSDALRVVREPRPGTSAARNRGLASASGELVAFTDDDVVVEPDWLHYLGARMVVEPELEGVTGVILAAELETEAQLWFEEYYGGYTMSFSPATWTLERMAEEDPLFPYAPGRYGAGANMAFRRASLEELGGFDPLLGGGTPARGGEDLALSVAFLLAGKALGFEPYAVVHHAQRRSRDSYFKQVYGYGIGLAAMETSLVANDRRHLVEMARRVPAALRRLVRPREERSVSRLPTYPRRTLLVQLAGMAVGPFAYAASRRRSTS